MLHQMAAMCRNRWFCIMCVCILAHQSFIGLSVYISVRLSSAVIEHGLGSQDVSFLVFIYIMLMVLPYLPGYFSGYCKTRWESFVLATFWADKAEIYQRSPSEHKLGFYTAQVRDVYGRFTQFAYYGLSSLLNFSLSLAMIGVFIDGRFLLAILMTLLLVFVVSRLTSGRMQTLSETESRETSSLTHHLKEIHPNAISGNVLNRRCWQNRALDQIFRFCSARNAHAGFQSCVFLLSSLFSLLPTSGLIVYLMLSADTSEAALLAVVINLTRIFHLIGSINDVIEIFLSLPSVRGLLNTLQEFGQADEPSPPVRLVQIEVNHQPAEAFDLSMLFQGRYRIRGKNGSGKTTFLRRLEKEQDILYFNPARRVDWPWQVDPGLSDGQYSRQCLDWLLTETDQPLALDEWDAFLDASNRNQVNQLIESQARQRVILEVRQMDSAGTTSG
ncbi:hypothetical protein VA7868_03402 [Vibrio aerogenes CECT 7868]|uniref:Uncharacterized protein n=1 Tax=Vibrio aerogenes CECT 7868 TaxID=1216006 RepID=A0A1M5ZYN0_9VIBR|nr:ABC transporter ATP-binding protein [Vibrio aerogenes]SHI29256.1 hypothetical protein VA7868_03402 [Vibrio aerogenes CECT 7868]